MNSAKTGSIDAAHEIHVVVFVVSLGVGRSPTDIAILKENIREASLAGYNPVVVVTFIDLFEDPVIRNQDVEKNPSTRSQ